MFRAMSNLLVAAHHNEASGYYTTSIPKPIVDILGDGAEVEAITYLIRANRIELKRQSKKGD